MPNPGRRASENVDCRLHKLIVIFEKENYRFFGIELIKIYLIGSNVSIFKNRKNVVNHSTLLTIIRVGNSLICSLIGSSQFAHLLPLLMTKECQERFALFHDQIVRSPFRSQKTSNSLKNR